MKISEFYMTDASDYAMYDNLRKISSCIDGLKPSSRKCLYTIIKNNIVNPLKVSQLMSKTSEQTNYLHGEQSLYGVLVGLAQNYAGSNNIPLLQREGAFGNRLINDAAASRYIFTCKEKHVDMLFMPDDNDILNKQFFEGDQIEPQFYLPIIPMLLVNGANGLTTGFRQLILPRNPLELINWIKCKLKKTKFTGKLLPYYKNFNGTIIKDKESSNKFFINGSFKIIPGVFPKIEITDIPVGYDLKAYIKQLDKLVDSKIIDSYDDYSENGTFKFIIKFTKNNPNLHKSKTILADLCLIKNATEQYTSLNENNKVIEYSSINELLENYYSVRYDYYKKRKEFKLNKLQYDIKIAVAKYTFIKGIIDNSIVIHKKTSEKINQTLDKINNIFKVNDSYSYLLNMPVSSFTKEKYEKLYEDIKLLTKEYKDLLAKSIEMLWLADLEILENFLKKTNI